MTKTVSQAPVTRKSTLLPVEPQVTGPCQLSLQTYYIFLPDSLSLVGHARKSRDVEHEPILHRVNNGVILTYANHKSFMVKLLDKCE